MMNHKVYEVRSFAQIGSRQATIVTEAVVVAPRNMPQEAVRDEIERIMGKLGESGLAERWPGFQVQGVPIYCL